MTTVINLYGGPGTGKSTTAAALFALMKHAEMNVELVTEYAKDVTWDERYNLFEDQYYISAKQNRRLSRLKDKVDWIVTDSPLILGKVYLPPSEISDKIGECITALHHHYTNIDIFLNRVKNYQAVGRRQSADEAKLLDLEIKQILRDEKINFIEVTASKDAAPFIFEYLFGKMQNG